MADHLSLYSASGNATFKAPKNGWEDEKLGTLFQANSTGTSTPNTNVYTAKSPTPLSAILGRVLGGLLIISLILSLVLCLQKRKRERAKDTITAGDELHELQGRRAESYGQVFYSPRTGLPVDQPLPVGIGPKTDGTQGPYRGLIRSIVGNCPLTTGSRTGIERI